jgi:hypothetical protein
VSREIFIFVGFLAWFAAGFGRKTTGLSFCGVAGRQGGRLEQYHKFCEAKPEAQKRQGRRFWAAQGIEAEQKPLTGLSQSRRDWLPEFALREWYSQVNKV